MPCAVLNTIVIAGPSLRIRWIAIPMATSAARSGMIQTMENRMRFLGTTVACGSLSRSIGSAMADGLGVSGVPDQARVEGLGGEHRQHNDRREEQNAGTRRHRHQRLQLH